MDNVFEVTTKKLEHVQQEYKTALHQRDFTRLQLESINDHLEDLEDEIQEYTTFLKNYEKRFGQT